MLPTPWADSSRSKSERRREQVLHGGGTGIGAFVLTGHYPPDELRSKPVANDIDWSRVDAFRPYGGIRIEDDVVCTSGAPENLTRDAFASIG